MYILGVTGYANSGSHDAAAALLLDGQIIAACEEERFTRKKHAWGASPIHATRFCLEHAGIRLRDVEAIAYGWNTDGAAISTVPAGSRTEWTNTMFPRAMFPEEEMPPVFQVRHHLAHIAGAFYVSGFRDAACICVDGQGESESITLAHANGGRIEVLKTFGKGHSLGAFYEAASKYAGLGYNVPGKLMGLAPYGTARHELPVGFDPAAGAFEARCWPDAESDDFDEACRRYLSYFEENWYPYRRGAAAECVSYVHVAASVQRHLEKVLCGIALHAARLTGSKNLVLCGGVALNCTGNGVVERSGIFEHVYVPPGANDASCSYGAALEVFRRKGCFERRLPPRLEDARLGPEYSNEEIALEFERAGLAPTYCDDAELCESVAANIAGGDVTMWFQGRSEFGPRALGARSILGNPCDRATHYRVNNIKTRELWRPLSPSILARAYQDYFTGRPTPLANFMLKAEATSPAAARRAPAIVHIDGSARPQIVDPAIDPKYHRLIEAFERRTGVPILMNTSFNRKGEPIVNSPRDAIEVFLACPDVGTLAVGNYFYEKPTQRAEAAAPAGRAVATGA